MVFRKGISVKQIAFYFGSATAEREEIYRICEDFASWIGRFESPFGLGIRGTSGVYIYAYPKTCAVSITVG